MFQNEVPWKYFLNINLIMKKLLKGSNQRAFCLLFVIFNSDVRCVQCSLPGELSPNAEHAIQVVGRTLQMKLIPHIYLYTTRK